MENVISGTWVTFGIPDVDLEGLKKKCFSTCFLSRNELKLEKCKDGTRTSKGKRSMAKKR